MATAPLATAVRGESVVAIGRSYVLRQLRWLCNLLYGTRADERARATAFRMSSTIAIMQPYFIPYAGYFRLFAGSDVFVVYDCVQFPRRGWVHRNRLPDRLGILRWLTLPLQKAPRDVLIRDLQFISDAKAVVEQRLRRFGVTTTASDARGVIEAIHDVQGAPVDYIVRILDEVAQHLGVRRPMLRSSSLDLAPALRGQDRIIAIARRLGARCYINAPGWESLYDRDVFAQAGIELRLLPVYNGSAVSILSRIMRERREDLAREFTTRA